MTARSEEMYRSLMAMQRLKRLTSQQWAEREARLRRLCGLYDLSSDELRELKQQSPGDPTILGPLVSALKREGRATEAVEELGRVIASGNRQERTALTMRACLLSKLGRLEEAIRDYERLVSLGDLQPANFFELGRLHHRRGDVRATRAAWRRAIEESHADVRKSAWYLRKRGDGEDMRRRFCYWMLATALNVGYYARFHLCWSYLSHPLAKAQPTA